MQRTETDVRGPLTIRTSTEDFRDFYWLKVELLEFCRENDLSTVGGKREIADRIEHFLRTGERLAPAPPSRPAARLQGSELTMDTQAPAGFRCTQEVRAFFVSHLGPDFRFTVTLQRFIQEHPGVTLGEVAEEWERQKEARRTGTLRPEIAPQFQYNQFTHDFYADPRNQGRSRQECQEAWLRTRERRGDKKYHPDEG